jgi:hypothetical protein
MKMAVVAGARPPIQAEWNREWVEIMRSCWAGEASKRPTFALVEQLLGRMMPQRQYAPGAQGIPEAGVVQQLVQQAASSAAGSPGFSQPPPPQQQQKQLQGAAARGAPSPMPQPRGMPVQNLQDMQQQRATPPPPHQQQTVQQPPPPMHQPQQHAPQPGLQPQAKLSPGIKTIAGSQYGGIVHDMEEM